MSIAPWHGGACIPANRWDDEAAEPVSVYPGEAPTCPPPCGRTLPPAAEWAPEAGSTGAIVICPRCPRCGARVRVRLLAE